MTKGLITRESSLQPGYHHNSGPRIAEETALLISRLGASQLNYRHSDKSVHMDIHPLSISSTGRLDIIQTLLLERWPITFMFFATIDGLQADAVPLWIEARTEIDMLSRKPTMNPVVRYRWRAENQKTFSESIITFDESLRQRDRRKLENAHDMMATRAHEVFVNGPLLMKATDLHELVTRFINLPLVSEVRDSILAGGVK